MSLTVFADVAMVPLSVPAVPVLLLWFKNVGGGRKYVRYLHHIRTICSYGTVIGSSCACPVAVV